MKNLLIASAAMFGVLSVPSFAFAQDDVILDEEVITPKIQKDWHIYADANLATAQFSSSEGNTTYVSDSTFAAYFRAGFKYKYFGVEAELGQGLSDIEEDGLSLGVSSQAAAFGVLRLPGDNYDVFLRAGYHSSTLEVGGSIFNPVTGGQTNVQEELTSDGFVAGVGGTYYFTDNLGLRADITGYNTRDLVDAGYVAASIGGTVKF